MRPALDPVPLLALPDEVHCRKSMSTTKLVMTRLPILLLPLNNTAQKFLTRRNDLTLSQTWRHQRFVVASRQAGSLTYHPGVSLAPRAEVLPQRLRRLTNGPSCCRICRANPLAIQKLHEVINGYVFPGHFCPAFRVKSPRNSLPVFDLPPLGPRIGWVVMIDVTEQQAVGGSMNNNLSRR